MALTVFRTKSIERSIQDTDEPGHKLKRELSALDLTVFGVGVIVGTGIFVLTGQQAARNAGPAIVISFLVAAVVCALAALCYAEFASTVPVAGSAYTFGYATLGELVAWIIGWDLVLELGLGAAVVARGWSAYLQTLFGLPTWLAGDDAIPDWGAIFIVALLTVVGVVGTKLSGRVTGILVAIKVAVVLFVIGLGLFYITSDNWSPFVPPGQPAPGVSGGEEPLLQALLGVVPQQFGIFGIVAAASIVFFAYIGFDVVATTAEETRNPQRDVPRGILWSLGICALLYMAVAFVVTGMSKYSSLDTGAPLAKAFSDVGVDWASKVISVGAVCGITTVILVLLLGQSRVLFAIVAGFVPLAKLSELTSIGTLFAFVVVAIGVVVLRRTRPDLPRSFRTPWVPVLPIVAVLACLWLMINLPVDTWIRFVIWMAIGFVLYFTYGMRAAGRQRASEAVAATPVSPAAEPHDRV